MFKKFTNPIKRLFGKKERKPPTPA